MRLPPVRARRERARNLASETAGHQRPLKPKGGRGFCLAFLWKSRCGDCVLDRVALQCNTQRAFGCPAFPKYLLLLGEAEKSELRVAGAIRFRLLWCGAALQLFFFEVSFVLLFGQRQRLWDTANFTACMLPGKNLLNECGSSEKEEGRAGSYVRLGRSSLSVLPLLFGGHNGQGHNDESSMTRCQKYRMSFQGW